MKKKHFRVKTGYGKDDFISIAEDDLSTAIRAQVTGRVAIFDEGTISGNHIIAIVPDYQREMGWGRDYQLTGEDYEYIGSKAVREHRDVLQNTKRAVQNQLGSLSDKLLTNGKALP
jgi:hypothetical protein